MSDIPSAETEHDELVAHLRGQCEHYERWHDRVDDADTKRYIRGRLASYRDMIVWMELNNG